MKYTKEEILKVLKEVLNEHPELLKSAVAAEIERHPEIRELI